MSSKPKGPRPRPEAEPPRRVRGEKTRVLAASAKGVAGEPAAKAKGGGPAKPSPRARMTPDVSPELRRVVDRVSDWAGGPRQALAWCREVGISALGGLTAEELVKTGREAALNAFLDHIAVGGFA